MRINDSNYGLYSYQSQQGRLNKNQIEKKLSASSDVKISARGQEISKAIASEQAERQTRIQELKLQVANGTYHVDSSKIADKLFGFWKNEAE